jgi:hypothetical protein
MGGLGNQIFQIFTTIAYAIKTRNQFKFLNLHQLGGGSTTIRYTFWNSFFSNLKPFLIPEIPLNIHVVREKGFPYNELSLLDLTRNDNILLYGYFQSYKYFHNHYSMICRVIGLDKMKENLLIINLFILKFFSANCKIKNAVSSLDVLIKNANSIFDKNAKNNIARLQNRT